MVGAPFDRAGVLLFDVVSGAEARAVAGITAETPDPDGDARAESLVLRVPLDIAAAGSYLVVGKLAGPGGEPAGEATVLLDDAPAGPAEAVLEFPSGLLAAAGGAGSFTLQALGCKFSHTPDVRYDARVWPYRSVPVPALTP